MKKYVLLIGDGNAAASRGTEGERLYTFQVEGKDVNDAINNAQKDILNLCDEESFEEYIEDYPEETFADYFNNLDPSGGDPWLVAYLEEGKLIDCYDLEMLKSGSDNAYEFDNYDDAKLFGMEPYVEDKRWGDANESLNESLLTNSYLKKLCRDNNLKLTFKGKGDRNVYRTLFGTWPEEDSDVPLKHPRVYEIKDHRGYVFTLWLETDLAVFIAPNYDIDNCETLNEIEHYFNSYILNDDEEVEDLYAEESLTEDSKQFFFDNGDEVTLDEISSYFADISTDWIENILNNHDFSTKQQAIDYIENYIKEKRLEDDFILPEKTDLSIYSGYDEESAFSWDEYFLANSDSEAFEYMEDDRPGNSEGYMPAEVSEFLDKDEIKDVILNELDEDKETKIQLLVNYDIPFELSELD